jgi:hypothetical protein
MANHKEPLSMLFCLMRVLYESLYLRIGRIYFPEMEREPVYGVLSRISGKNSLPCVSQYTPHFPSFYISIDAHKVKRNIGCRAHWDAHMAGHPFYA